MKLTPEAASAIWEKFFREMTAEEFDRIAAKYAPELLVAVEEERARRSAPARGVRKGT